MRGLLLAAVISVLVLSTVVSFVNVLGYELVGLDTSVSDVTVKYFRSFFGLQQVKIVVADPLGRTYPTTLSVYGWAPNGSVIELGRVLAKNGVAYLSTRKIVEFLEEWRKYLESRGNDPKLVKVGLIVLGAIHSPKGVYGIVKGIPLSIAKVLSGASTEIRIVARLTPKNLLASMDRVKELARLATTHAIKGVATRVPLASSSTWPPKQMIDYCDSICFGKYCVDYCFIWVLDKVYAVAIDRGAPLVAVYLRSPIGDNYVNRVNDVLLREYFEADESKGIEIAFGILASVKKGSGEISYSIPGFTIELGGDKHVWLDYYARFFEGRDFNGDAVLAIGMKGDFAFAKYELQYCYSIRLRGYAWRATQWPSWTPYGCLPEGEANMTLARPVIVNNEIVPWREVDTNPYDGSGVAEKVLDYIEDNWMWSKNHVGRGGVYIDAFTVSNEINTHPLFSTSIAVLPALLSDVPEALPFAAIVSASVGLTKKEMSKMLVLCYISVKEEYASSTYIWANYFYSPTRFEYKGSKYYVGSLYVDALVFSPG